jgi:adenylate cyclase
MRDPATLEKLKDKLVIIGVTAKSIKDEVGSPFSPRTHGFVMHGYVADQLIRWAKAGEAPPVFSSRTVDAVWTAGWVLFGAITGGIGVARSLWKMMLFVVLELLVLIAAVLWAMHFGTILPVVPPLLGLIASVLLALAYMSAVERKDRQMVQQLINMHISREVAEQLLENQDAFSEGGKLAPQRMTATVLFSDLMNFTPIAERLDSTALMNWLNDFFEQMTLCVEQCGGVVNKFNGDMVMALFGPPRVREKDEDVASDARNAVRCAVLMRRALAKMNVTWEQQGLPTPLMRIGIYTGPLVAGSLGGKKRIEYTVIGDTVNTASRLESSNKECMDDAIDGTRIIIGDTTCAAIEGRYHVRGLGEWELKGKEPLRVHAVLGEVETALLQTSEERGS